MNEQKPKLCEENKNLEKRFEDNSVKESEKNLTGAAQRALAEAACRRLSRSGAVQPKEIAGRGGLDPVRFGDWEKNGLISDF